MRRHGRCDPASGSADEQEYRGEDGCQAALQPARRAGADHVTHGEPEIEATRLNQDPLQNVRVPIRRLACVTQPANISCNVSSTSVVVPADSRPRRLIRRSLSTVRS